VRNEKNGARPARLSENFLQNAMISHATITKSRVALKSHLLSEAKSPETAA